MSEIRMREYDYIYTPQKLLTPEIVSLITKIYEYKGRQDLFIEADKNVLTTLQDVAKIQSTASANRIEGIFTSDKRLVELVHEEVQPKKPFRTRDCWLSGSFTDNS